MCNPENMSMMCKVEKRILEALCEETERGLAEVDTDELGKAVDMVKDMAEAKYYASVVEAMNAEKYGEMPERWSEGRHKTAYGPVWDDGSMMRGGAYDKYVKARDGFHGHASDENRRMMEESADEYIREMEKAVREMWSDASHMHRERMRNAIMTMANGLM